MEEGREGQQATKERRVRSVRARVEMSSLFDGGQVVPPDVVGPIEVEVVVPL